MIRTLLLLGLVLLFVSCAQQKQVGSHQPATKPTHRYTTVYEGNRVLKYERDTASHALALHSEKRLVPNLEEVDLRIQRKGIANLPRTFIRTGQSKLESSKADRAKKEELQSDKATARGGWLSRHPGTIGFILFLLSIPLLFASGAITLLSFALAILAFIFAIIGMVQKNSPIDVALGQFVVWINILALIFLIVLFIFSLV